MSKYLVKILSIYALIVLFAVTIVGAAICVTEAVGCTLTIADASDRTTGGESSVAIYIDGKKQEGDKVHVSKYTEVTIKYEGVGYDFVGWYEGQYDMAKDKAVSDKTSYTFEVKKSTKMTAETALRTFNVTFTGTLADGTTPVTSDTRIPTTKEYRYGEELPKPESSEDNFFYGWNVVGDEATEARNFNYALFDQKEVTVVTNWGAQEYINYTINVAYNRNALDDKDVLTYNKKDGLSAYTRTRDCYKISAIKFNEKDYLYNSSTGTFDGLGLAVEKYGQTVVDAVAVWTCDYSTISIKLMGVARYSTADLEEDYLGLKAKSSSTGNLVRMELPKYSATFTDEDGRDNFDLADDIYAYFLKGFNTEEAPQTIDGRAVNFARKLIISINGTNLEFEYNLTKDSVSYKDVVTKVEQKNGNSMTGVNGITVKFVYTLAA